MYGNFRDKKYGYHLDDVGKVVLGMDSVIGIDLKEQIFGKYSSLDKLEHAGKIEWPQSLARCRVYLVARYC